MKKEWLLLLYCEQQLAIREMSNLSYVVLIRGLSVTLEMLLPSSLYGYTGSPPKDSPRKAKAESNHLGITVQVFTGYEQLM